MQDAPRQPSEVTMPEEDPAAAAAEDQSAEVAAADAPPTVDVMALQAELARSQQRVADLERERKDLEKRAADAGEQTRQYAAAYDKARSEFAAARERLTREQERMQKRQLAKTVSGLLGVLDHFDRFVDGLKSGATAGASVGQSYVDGAEMIRSQFDTALQAMGLQRFDGMGEAFDPERHQAVTTMTVLDPAQDGKIVAGIAAGAVLGDEVVRPATVVVGKCLAVGSDAVN